MAVGPVDPFSNPSMPRHSLSWWLVGGAIALAIGTATTLLYQEYRAINDAGRERAEALTLIAATHVQQLLSAIEVSMQSLDSDPSSPGITLDMSPEDMHQVLRQVSGILPPLQGIGVLDEQGNIVANVETAHPAPLNLSDRAYFQFHHDQSTDRILLGRPIISRPQGILGIPISRRIDHPDGTFAGVIVGRINPKYFVDFFEALGAGAVALTLPDGTVLSRFPDIDLTTAPVLPFAAEKTTDLMPTTMDLVSPLDGVDRLAAFRRVADKPLFVEVGIDRAQLLAAWESKRNVAIALVAAVILLLVSSTVFVRKRSSDAMAMLDMGARTRAEIMARRQADEVSRSKSEFLSHMSHELRTPLNAIIGFSEVIKSESFGPVGQPKYQEYADDIHYSAQHLLALINNILDLSKVEAGKWQIVEENVTLDDLFGSLFRIATDRARREHVQIAVKSAPNDVIIRGDRRTLLQIMLNLTINAIKFSGDNHKVDLNAETLPDGSLEITITDYGEGMSATDLALAMKPFDSPSSHVARSKQDTGLGLPLAKAFAELHEGQVILDSKVGVGTVARLRLPAKRIRRAA